MEFQLWSIGIANRGMVYKLARCLDWYFGLDAMSVVDGYARVPASCIKPSFGPQALHRGVLYLSHYLQRLHPTMITMVSPRKRYVLTYLAPICPRRIGVNGVAPQAQRQVYLPEAGSSQDVAQFPIRTPCNFSTLCSSSAAVFPVLIDATKNSQPCLLAWMYIKS